MVLENYKSKKSVVLVFTGDGKGKTSAAIGTLVRALGNNHKCAFIQFIKDWQVGEHKFFDKISKLYKDQLTIYKGGRGFYQLGELSAKNVSDEEHEAAVQATYSYSLEVSESGNFDLVVCDEINTALQEGLLTKKQLQLLIANRHQKTSLCLTGRGFPTDLIDAVDIATEMTKLKHHFDNKFLANRGIDF